MTLAVAAVLFAIYISNVVAGAIFRSPFMGDVPEMLVLLCASLFFVAAILRAERKSKEARSQ